MNRVHIVKRGECLSSIAAAYGFADYRRVYEHADNAAFRKRRPNPHVLSPGDELFIPEAKTKNLFLQTGKRHAIVVRRPKKTVRVRLQDSNGVPLAQFSYELEVGGSTVSGQTNSDGCLEAEIPAEVQTGMLVLGGTRMTLQIGFLNPLSDCNDGGVSGVQARLANLGYQPGPVDGVLGSRTLQAVSAFQRDHSLEETGEVDAPTLGALEREHGC
jgi:N-acetylmuramoyl-L-alanine amidase